jgi:hypothetical protein
VVTKNFIEDDRLYRFERNELSPEEKDKDGGLTHSEWIKGRTIG